MNICSARVTPIRLPLREPLHTAHGTIRDRRGALLELFDDAGRCGLGEALPLAGFIDADPERTPARLASALRALLARSAGDLDERLAQVADLACDDASIADALDVALHDLSARTDDVSLADCLARRHAWVSQREIPVSTLVAALTPEAARAAAVCATANGYTALKLKVGVGSPEIDAARVEAARAGGGPALEIRADANAGWHADEAVRRVARLAAAGVTWIEQPCAAQDLRGLARVRAQSSVPIVADESAASEAAIARLIEMGAVDGIVIRRAVLGGLAGALRAARLGAAAGLQLVASTLIDGAVGRAASRALAAVLPGVPLAAGIATAEWLAADLAAPERVVRGRLQTSDGPGLGVLLDASRVRALATGPVLELRAP